MKYFLNKVIYLLFFTSSIFFIVSCGDEEESDKKEIDCSDGVYIPFQEKEDGRLKAR